MWSSSRTADESPEGEHVMDKTLSRAKGFLGLADAYHFATRHSGHRTAVMISVGSVKSVGRVPKQDRRSDQHVSVCRAGSRRRALEDPIPMTGPRRNHSPAWGTI